MSTSAAIDIAYSLLNDNTMKKILNKLNRKAERYFVSKWWKRQVRNALKGAPREATGIPFGSNGDMVYKSECGQITVINENSKMDNGE